MKRLLLLLTALTPLAACTGLGPVRQLDVRLPSAFEAPAGAAAPAPAAELDRWWTLYQDPQLQALVEQALASAPDARIAEARLREARAQRNANRRLAYPQGNLSGSASRTQTTILSGPSLDFPGFGGGVSENYALNFDVSWEVDLFGRVRQGQQVIEQDYLATRFNVESSRASLAANVADSLFSVRGLAVQLADARETARIRRELSQISRRLAERGLAASSDLQRTEADLAQAEAAAAGAEADLQAARRQLLVLLGQGASPVASLPAEAGPLGQIPTPPAIVPGDLLARRPDVRESEARLLQALSQYKADQLALFPSFNIMPGAGLTKASQPSFSMTSANWTLGAGLTVPVLDRPRLKQLAKVSGARADQAVTNYERAVQTAYGEAENALVQLAADRNRVALLTAGEAQARAAYEAARTRYAAGLDDLTATLSAEQSWRAARTALTGAQVQALRRSVQAFKALGGGWTPAPGGAS